MTNLNPALSPDVFEAVVTAFAETLIRHYRERWHTQAVPQPTVTMPKLTSPESSPWLTVKEVAERTRCGRHLVYDAVRTVKLRAARIGGGRVVRVHVDWVDQWLQHDEHARR